MNILLVYRHWAVSSGRYMTDAFKRLGHDVRHIGPAHGRDIWGITVDAKYVHEPDDLADVQFDWKPDLIIVMDSDSRVLDEADQYQGVAPIIVYGVDNHVRDYRRPWFEHYFLAHRGVSVMDWRELGWSPAIGSYDFLGTQRADMTWLPCAYDPTIFTPSPIPYAEREYDVCMIGVMYPQRWQLVNALKAAGLKVYAGTGLLFQDFRDAYWNSRVSLCISIAGDVAQRIFETSAMGCAVVSDPCADFERLNIYGSGLIIQSKDESIVQLCVDLITNPEIAQRHIEKILEWVKPHSWDERAKQILSWLEQHKASETGQSVV